MNEYVILSIEHGEYHAHFPHRNKSFFAFDPPQAATQIRRWLKSPDSYSFRKNRHIPSGGIMVFVTIIKYTRSPNRRHIVKKEMAGTYGFRL